MGVCGRQKSIAVVLQVENLTLLPVQLLDLYGSLYSLAPLSMDGPLALKFLYHVFSQRRILIVNSLLNKELAKILTGWD